jgi:hypothetical protein
MGAAATEVAQPSQRGITSRKAVSCSILRTGTRAKPWQSGSPELLMSSVGLAGNSSGAEQCLITTKRQAYKQVFALWFVPNDNSHIVTISQSSGI